MSVLLDTNVFLRRMQPNHEHYEAAVESVARLLGTGETVCFTSQTASEFWNVSTRPVANNGLALPVSLADSELATIERIFTFLPDSPDTYAEWRRLVVKHSVIGVRVHDTRLVATMNVHGVSSLLTFNISDFLRYGIDLVHPSSVAP